MAQTIWDEPTGVQSVVLGAILAARDADGSWPTVPQLAEHLRDEVDVRAVLDSFPVAETGSGARYGAIWREADAGHADGGRDASGKDDGARGTGDSLSTRGTGSTRGSGGSSSEDRGRVGLTLAAGLLTVDYEIAPYLAMIRTCANRVANTGPVTMTSSRFHRQFGADHAFHVRTFPAVLQREPLGADAGIQSDDDGWTIALGDGFGAYAGVRHLKDYVHKTVDAPAEETPHAEYVDPALISALAATQHPARDRLLAVLSELNSNYAAGNPYATLLLHRVVTSGNTDVTTMADVPPPGSLDAVIRALVERS